MAYAKITHGVYDLKIAIRNSDGTSSAWHAWEGTANFQDSKVNESSDYYLSNVPQERSSDLTNRTVTLEMGFDNNLVRYLAGYSNINPTLSGSTFAPTGTNAPISDSGSPIPCALAKISDIRDPNTGTNDLSMRIYYLGFIDYDFNQFVTDAPETKTTVAATGTFGKDSDSSHGNGHAFIEFTKSAVGDTFWTTAQTTIPSYDDVITALTSSSTSEVGTLDS